jgi:hypothetical protein
MPRRGRRGSLSDDQQGALKMSDVTPRFAMPYLVPGQAQKEQFHNEALLLADCLLHPAIEDGPLTTPPASPQPGQIWLAAAGPTGAWAGQGDKLAIWTDSGWRFASPTIGMEVWKKVAGLHLRWSGTAWVAGEVIAERLMIGGLQLVGSRQPSVPSPSGGTTIDAEARAAVAAVIVALRSHGLID